LAWLVKFVLPAMHPAFAAAFILGTYGVVFFAAGLALRLPEASAVISRLR